MKQTKGYMWGRKNITRLAKTAVTKAGAHAYVGRRVKKRDNRALWQIRISAALTEYGLSYSRFIDGLKKAQIDLDRKILSDLAANNKKIFKAIVEAVEKK